METTTFKILVAVDGSENSKRAVEHVLQLARSGCRLLDVHVLNVQSPIPFGDIKRFVGQDTVNAYYQEEGSKALRPARAVLEKSAVPHTFHIAVGAPAETIVDYAREHQCTQIILGCRGLTALSGLLLGSVASKVLHLTDVPVTLIK